MARLLMGAVLGVVVGVVAGAALDLSAEPTEDVVQAAELAGVDPVALHGALLTVGEPDPKRYLYHSGELARPPQPAAVIPSIWQALAACESNGRWHINTGNGYFGGLQADMTFWRRHGGLAYAPRPDLATPEQQILVAQRGQAVQGWRAWPACSRRLGLR